MEPKMGILKKYADGYVMPVGRYSQIRARTLLPHQLLTKDLVGHVWNNGCWILYREGGRYFRSFFVKNVLWYDALVAEREFAAIAKLPQITLI